MGMKVAAAWPVRRCDGDPGPHRDPVGLEPLWRDQEAGDDPWRWSLPIRCLDPGHRLELQLVSAHDYDLVGVAPDRAGAYQRGLSGDVKPEITQAMIATGICDGYADALPTALLA